MNLADRFFALAATPPFDRLGSAELMPIAEVARRRTFPAGAPIGTPGRPLSKLYVVIEGDFEDGGGGRSSHVAGLGGVLQDRPRAAPLRAGDSGATVLLFERGHVFTILFACPGLTLGLADLPVPGERPADTVAAGAPA
ncbi:MAG: hypothetical protein AAGF23_07025 [Acidobacteriota bacterium]